MDFRQSPEFKKLRAQGLVVRGVLFRERKASFSNWDNDKLEGACGMATNLLHQLLGLDMVVGGFEGGALGGSSHCWNLWEGRIFDITATQFGVRERVYVVAADYRYEELVRGAAALRLMRRSFNREMTFPDKRLLERTKEALRRAEERR